MINWIKGRLDADIKAKLEDILRQVLVERQEVLLNDIISHFFKLLEAPVYEAIDTHGIEINGLTAATEALMENPKVSHTIYYDAESKEVYIRANNVRGMQNDVDLLSPHCPYVCRVHSGQGMTIQEIADKISEAVERNIMMALIDSKYRSLAEDEKTKLLFTREGIIL